VLIAMPRRRPISRNLQMARVLLVDDEVPSRLTLQTLLQASGYSVDVAASAAEAVGKLDERQYELVLSDLRMESPEAGLQVLAHARLKDYQPATALVRAYHDSKQRWPVPKGDRHVTIETEAVPDLLDKVAELIGMRASRRVNRTLRHAASET
jgi:CheY-like chemotaxis protein